MSFISRKASVISFQRSLLCLLLLCLVLLPLPAENAAAQVASPSEYDLKAAFLLKFFSYVTWPDDAGSAPDPDNFEERQELPYLIGILGDDPFGDTIDRVFDGKEVHNRPFRLLRADDPESLTDCHLVFISPSEAENGEALLKRFAELPVLTVSDIDDLGEKGCIINFFIEKNKMRFAINHAAAQEVGLDISSKLLSLARIIS